MKYSITIILLFLASVLAAQTPADKPEPQLPALAAEDKLAVRNAQIESMNAFDAVQKTAEYRNLQAAQASQTLLWRKIFDKYKIDISKVMVCDGPDAGSCKDVAKGELEFKPVLKEQAKK